MIELQNLKKVYTSKRHKDCEALKGLSLTLPDKGMVFVLGKSGSGKSTFLNLLGGLDAATDGKIIVDGNDLSALCAADNDGYRSTYVGFVFQSFCLIDTLTVAENVRLALDLLGGDDERSVTRALADVELSEYADRYPRELSGGQCQRVAIARALVKSPKLILADEPTGNLDSKTAKQVLGVLKELSRERLVVIVTHNVDDATQYGDRIIELSDGACVHDVERSREARVPLIDEDVITLPREGILSDGELDAINARIKEGGVRITQEKDPFSKTEQPADGHRKVPFARPARMRPRASLKLCTTLSRGGRLGALVTSVILTVLALLLCFAQAFCFFDSEPLLRDAISATDDKSFSLHKGYYSDDVRDTTLKMDLTVAVTEEDVNAFYEAGYEGNAYFLYPTEFSFCGTGSPLETGTFKETVLDYTSPYAKYGNGVLVTDEAFLTKLYGTEQGLTLLAGEISERSCNSGVFISDYAADCLLNYHEKLRTDAENPYQNVVDRKQVNGIKVSGVFQTGYKERYGALLEEYEALLKISDEKLRREAVEQLIGTERFTDFVNEVDKYLAIGYYLGENYGGKVIGADKMVTAPRFHNVDLYGNGTLLAEDVGWKYVLRDDVAPGTALLGPDTINGLIGTQYTGAENEAFTPFPITFAVYANEAGGMDEPLYTHTLLVVGFAENKDGGFRFAREDFEKLHYYDHYAYAVYFDNVEDATVLYETGAARGFYTNNLYFKSVHTVKQIVEAFKGIFIYVGAAIALVSFLFITSYSLLALRRRRTEVGILRALGAKTSQIAGAFIVQMVLLGLIAAVASAILLPFVMESANAVLAENLAIFLDNPIIGGLQIIEFSMFGFLAVFGAFIPVLVLSSAVPFLVIRRLKPMSIIRSAD